MKHSATATAGDFDEVEETGTDKTEVTFEKQVNDAAATMIEGEDGLWALPEKHGLSKEVAYAAGLEKRRRDTQSAAAKTSHKLEASVERNGKLESKLKENFVATLSKDQQEELEDLKGSDPDAYREKYNEYEAAAQDAFEEELAEMGYDDSQINELADRSTQLDEFLEANPGLELNDEVFENDLPPRLVKELEEGKINFGEFLEKAKTALTSTAIAKDDDDDEPDLGEAGGGSTASDTAVAGDEVKSYKETVF